MTETPKTNESFEALPSEEQVFSAVREICGEHAFIESNRVEKEGKLRSLEIRLTEPNPEGLMMQLEYFVSNKGVATVDVAYFDPGANLDYRAYDPRDIVRGKRLGKFSGSTWVSEDPLFESVDTFEYDREQLLLAAGYEIEHNEDKSLTVRKNGYKIILQHLFIPSKFHYQHGKIAMIEITNPENKVVIMWGTLFKFTTENADGILTEKEALSGDADAGVIFKELVALLN